VSVPPLRGSPDRPPVPDKWAKAMEGVPNWAEDAQPASRIFNYSFLPLPDLTEPRSSNSKDFCLQPSPLLCKF
jgi:hypothetical protein